MQAAGVVKDKHTNLLMKIKSGEANDETDKATKRLKELAHTMDSFVEVMRTMLGKAAATTTSDETELKEILLQMQTIHKEAVVHDDSFKKAMKEMKGWW